MNINDDKSNYSSSIKLQVQNIGALLDDLGTITNFVVEDDTLNKAFDYIANHNKILVAFDIEFHNRVSHENSNFLGTMKNNKFVAPFVRELGMVFLIKNTMNKWNYFGNMFINFPNDYSNDSIIYILSKYASISDPSRKVMEKNDSYFNVLESVNEIVEDDDDDNDNESAELSDKQINQIESIEHVLKRPFIKKVLGKQDYGMLRVFLGYLIAANDNKKFRQTLNNIRRLIKDVPYNITRLQLNDNELHMFNKQLKTYYTDTKVKKRMINKEDQKAIFNLLTQIDKLTCYVVKGKMDFYALKNDYFALYKTSPHFKFNYVYDIEIFNKVSNDKYGSAQLEKTFEGMSGSLMYKKYLDSFVDKILGSFEDQRAHNPLIDSFYTIVVALMINLVLLLSLEQE